MSYCRWSSDNYKCDLYCYADVSGGYTTHIAYRRIVGDVPEIPDIPYPVPPQTDPFWKKHEKARKIQEKFLESEKTERPVIKLTGAGQSFNDPDLPSFYQRLLDLRQIGYLFPDSVLEQVKEEMDALDRLELDVDKAMKEQQNEQKQNNL